MKNKSSKLTQKNGLLKAVIKRILFTFIMCVVGLNTGKWIGTGLIKLIMWLGILPYLEKFFGWFVF